jgi:DNA-directed RNA polymerase subunit alpha
MRLRAEGPGEVTAGRIETGHDIEILNPDLVLCTLDKGAKLNMEFTVTNGKGYVPASQNRPDDAPIGLIPVDSLYSPVRRVSYKVDNSRVGQVTDYDKLSMQVETNGAVTPEDAVALAARILQDQLQLFINFKSEGRSPKTRARTRRNKTARRSTSSNPVRSANCLERQHHLYRRSHPEERSRDAAHAELRPQVAQRDQGSPGPDGAPSRHGNPRLAAGEHRRPGEAARRALLIA